MLNLPLRRVALVLLFGHLAFAAPAVAAERIATRFEVLGFAGFDVLTLRSRIEESGDRYGIAIDYATKGLARLFINLTTHAEVRGRIVGGAAQPERFRNDTRRNGVDRHSRLAYRPDGNVDDEATPALPDPLAPAAMRGTIDNLTAYFRLERQLARTGSCVLIVRVFDGRHGYDLAFSDAGRTALRPKAGQNFAGEAIACRMVRINWPGLPDPERDEGARQGTIWYARLIPGDLMVPVRLRMDTQLGAVHGFLAELHGGGVDLALME